jgi:hypothetical protein
MAVCRVCTIYSPRAGSHPYLLVQGVTVRGSRRSEPVRMLCENMTGQVKEDADFYKQYQHFYVLKSSVLVPGCLSRIRIFPSRMDPGSKAPGSRICNREF